jgi:VIT1/CCC1 family predicted Fe2+/Mn2+ transporter
LNSIEAQMSEPSDILKEPPESPPPKKMTGMQLGMIIGVAGAVGGFQGVAPAMFPPPPGGGFNFTRTLVAAAVGAVGAVIGAGIGSLFDRKSPDPKS